MNFRGTSNIYAERQKESNPDKINVVFPCDEWKSSKGGLSTLNREFAINWAKSSVETKVHCYVTQSDERDREDARRHNVNLITAQRIPGSMDPLDCLKIPPPGIRVDIVVGHGRKFGVPAYFIKRQTNCIWLQFVHVCSEDLGKYKKKETSGEDTIDDNENKHRCELDLCKAADMVVAVGHKLQDKYKFYLHDIAVQILTPGIFESFQQLVRYPSRLCPIDEDSSMTDFREFNVFVIGRLKFEDLFVKGFDIIAKAVASLGERFKLFFVGSPAGQQTKLLKWFRKKTGITCEQLTIRRYCDREELKEMFRQADLVALPSRVEGFGLIALEAISASVPVLISSLSGLATALGKVQGGSDVIVTSKEPKEWAKRIEKLSRQTPEERSDNAIRLRENYKETYPWENECIRFINLVRDLLDDDTTSNKENIDRSLPQPVQRPLEKVQNKGREMDITHHDPALLQRQMCWNIGRLFGPHTQFESQQLRWGDISLEKDAGTGKEMLVMKDEYDSESSQALQPMAKVRSLESHQSPVNIYKAFRGHRPKEINNPDSPFYPAVKRRRKPSSQVWYMRRRQGVNKLGTAIHFNPKQQRMDRFLLNVSDHHCEKVSRLPFLRIMGRKRLVKCFPDVVPDRAASTSK